MRSLIWAATAAISFLLGFSALPVQAAELVMVEQRACPWCAKWDREIGTVYPKTEEGRIAPLRRVSLEEDWPADLAGITKERFTPVFILLHEGKEYGRIRGYPGEDFFWGLLGELIGTLPADARGTLTQ